MASMKQVADWQLAHPSSHSPTDWTQGAYYTGMMALYGVSHDKTYLDAMVKMGEANQWKPGKRQYHADDHAVCQTYCELYLLQKDAAAIAPTKALFDSILSNPKNGSLEFNKPGWSERWSWCDSLFMAPAAWARLSAVTGDKRYVEFMDREWWNTTAYLYDPAEGLFYRDSSYFARKTPDGHKLFWLRGNGWVYAGIARVVDFLPPDFESRPKYLKLFQELTASVVKTQQEDGLWHPSLLDATQVPTGEASGSGFFCYGLAWGVNRGVLDKAKYWPRVVRSWTALVSKVHPDGMLGNVQPIGAAPDALDANSTEVYGTGAFLLAGSEIYKLLTAPDHPR
jgi:rhamnogalacturonyl hydrolase YesR